MRVFSPDGSEAAPSTEDLLREFVRRPDPSLRDAIIERHRGLVHSLARKFARPGVSVEDLVQTGWVALIGALDRFDPEHNTRFSTYAVHCIVGEIKRYFRDRTWAMRVPRHLQEIAANLHRVEDRLYQRLQRAPTVPEMAEEFCISEEELLQAMELYRAYQVEHLEGSRSSRSGEDLPTLAESIGHRDLELDAVVEQAPVRAALAGLDDRKRRILERRYWDGWTQQEVAVELGVSQMHVSRLERAALVEMQRALQPAGT